MADPGARSRPAARAASSRRTCIGCRRVAAPGELVRVARRPDGSIGVGRHEPGRGAWLCAARGRHASPACFEAAVRRRAFGRALRCELDGDQLDILREKLCDEGNSRLAERKPERPQQADFSSQ